MVCTLVVLVLTSPPSPEQLEEQRQRVQAIYALGEAEDDASLSQLLTILRDSDKDWEQLAALQALREGHRERALPTVQSFLRHPDPALRTAAAVRSYQWAPEQRVLHMLESLRAYGGALRRAFQTGEREGRPLYRPEALKFFEASAAHSQIVTRLDGAMGLVEIGTEPQISRGLQVIRTILGSSEPSERRLAVQHLSVQYVEPALRPLLETAAADNDAQVSRLAREILQR
jgi:HEAT repeat protein